VNDNYIWGYEVGRRRGFLAEMQHQARVAEQRQRAAAREQAASARRAEQAWKAEQRAQAALQRASEADRKRLEKEAHEAHVASRQAEVEQLNAELASVYDQVDSLLESTLAVDDYVDLASLRRRVEHPPFDRRLERPIPAPAPLLDPPAPVFEPPAPPTGLFGRKKKLAEAQSQAEAAFAQAYSSWEHEMAQLPGRRQAIADRFTADENNRKQRLAAAQARYLDDCAAREAEVAEHNASIDQLITNLSYGSVEAVQEYVGIVLANSVYPEGFTVEHEAQFEPGTAELALRVLIPSPDQISTIKSYKYFKASDEITPAALAQKEAKDRYAGIVHQVALRTLHEIFEADRRALIQSIGLEVGTQTINPATGNETYIPFAALGVSREAFSGIDLSAVVPAATLEHLGAAVSKNPLGLTPANVSGVRRS
jgi:restriction system protein